MRLTQRLHPLEKIALQRNVVRHAQFLADFGAFVIERMSMVVAQDLADADRVESDRDHGAQHQVAVIEAGTLQGQLGQEPAAVEIGQYQERILDGTAFAAGRDEDAVEPFGHQVLALAAECRGVGDVGNQIYEDPGGRIDPGPVGFDELEKIL